MHNRVTHTRLKIDLDNKLPDYVEKHQRPGGYRNPKICVNISMHSNSPNNGTTREQQTVNKKIGFQIDTKIYTPHL